jgi:hypothetical protein
MRSISAAKEEAQAPDRLTEPIVDKLNNPSTSSDFDFHEGVTKSRQKLECQPQTAVGN